MRLATVLVVSVFVVIAAGCGGGGHAPSPQSALCSSRPTPSPRAQSVRRPSPSSTALGPVYADFDAALSKYYESSYRATYDFCTVAEDDGSMFAGSIDWYKDGVARLRVDQDVSVDGKRFRQSSFAIIGASEPRLAECSDDLGAYYRILFGGARGRAFAQAYPEVNAYLSLGATCIVDELGSHEDMLTHTEPYGLSPVELENFRAAPVIYTANLTKTVETIQAGSRVLSLR